MTHRPLTKIAHEHVESWLRPGDFAIDATVGNGHDTLFLAERVGVEGRVLGFDIQSDAIEAARARLLAGGIDPEQFSLVHGCHSRLAEECCRIGRAPRAIMFNFGYLPGGDKAIITRQESSLAALDAALGLVAPGGGITAVVYPGHPGGEAEAEAIRARVASLDGAVFETDALSSRVASAQSPELLVIKKRGPAEY